MNVTKIAKGIGFPPHLLKDADFQRAPKGSRFYCYVLPKDGSKHAFTKLQALRLSNRGGKNLERFVQWLAQQEDPIKTPWEE